MSGSSRMGAVILRSPPHRIHGAHNDGLDTRGKLVEQLAAGAALGLLHRDRIRQ
jgi:hypothetical protein